MLKEKNVGFIKMYNFKKGYGFIHTKDGEDLFFHCSALMNPNEKKSIGLNIPVKFRVEKTDRGLKAIEIEIN